MENKLLFVELFEQRNVNMVRKRNKIRPLKFSTTIPPLRYKISLHINSFTYIKYC